MSEFVMIDSHEVLIQNPSRGQLEQPNKLRTFHSPLLFQFAIDDFGDEFIYSINNVQLRYQSMELSRNITYWRFADNTCALSYLTDPEDDRTRHFVSQPWELRSVTRELNLQISCV